MFRKPTIAKERKAIEANQIQAISIEPKKLKTSETSAFTLFVKRRHSGSSSSDSGSNTSSPSSAIPS
jgi:hypothetical protein